MRQPDVTQPCCHHRPRLPSSSSRDRRLLLVGLGLGGIPDALLASALVPLVGSRLTEQCVGTALVGLGHVALLDGAVCVGDGREGQGGVDQGDDLAGVNVLAVTSLGLAGLAGEDNQASLVGLEALDVGGKGLLGEVGAAGVDGDTDGGSDKLGDTGGLIVVSIVPP